MGPSEKAGIVQFCGNNFENWKFRVEKHLAAAGVLEAVKSTQDSVPNQSEFGKMDTKAQDIITSLISDDYLEYIRDKLTAKQMWDGLIATFACKSSQNQTIVRKELANLRFKENDRLNQHFLKFDSLIRQLKSWS